MTEHRPAMHFRPVGRIPPDHRGRCACGFFAASSHATMVWKRVTCKRCRMTVAFEATVQDYLHATLPTMTPADRLHRQCLLQRHGWPLATNTLPT